MTTTVLPPSQPGQAVDEAPRYRQRRRHQPRRPAGPGAASDAATSGRDEVVSRSVNPSSASPALRPASIPPTSQTPRTARGRGGRGGGGRNNGRSTRGGDDTVGNHQSRPRTSSATRLFGGQLTTSDATPPTFNSSTLQGDAPEFHPHHGHEHRSIAHGDQSQTAKKHVNTPPRLPRTRRGSKSSAADIATRTHEDIAHGVYECPICTNEVGRNSKVWSCKTCWTVFHLGCIKRWSKNEGSVQAQQTQHEGVAPPRMWRCPGCNLPKDVLPTVYACWCAKEIDPRPYPGLPPHSCGQTCGKARVLSSKCPHPCELVCHAGPCPPCSHIGPTQSCFCGKGIATRQCVDTDYDSGWSCGQICGDPMPCGEHDCQRECHEGLCGSCETKVEARCYCGELQQKTRCGEKEEERKSRRAIHQGDEKIIESWIGSFSCHRECGRPFDCGKHNCKRGCHAQDAESAQCPSSPDVVSHCPCGKTPLDRLLERPRERCKDAIPNCLEKCSRPLSCGHMCQQVCHSGECMPCLQTITIHCRCGRVSCTTACHQASTDPPWCMRICRTTLNCGRHECGERCCPGERKATERQSSKRKLRPLNSAPRLIDEGFEAEHICTRTCGRSLKCGSHTCPELCHKGPCGSCREAIFEDVGCNCGRTVLQPPLPCGTKAPPCRYDCQRAKVCSHPQIPHNCHGDDEVCPKCPFLTEKPCMCGKKTLKHQPCWLSDVRCGEPCGRLLRCGAHHCQKQCHRSGECEDAGSICLQRCGKAKKLCGHPCEETCHAPYPCREDKPCPQKVLITCECQNLKQEIRCNASKSSEGNTATTLKCDDECARLQRNHKLAVALDIDPATHTDDHIPYSKETLKKFQDNVKWAMIRERVFRVFAIDESEKRLRFKPMPAHQRAFLHALAEDYGLDSESMDPEPYRHVAVFKTPRFVSAPLKTLSQCVEIRPATEKAANSSGVTDTQRKLATASNVDIPFNALLLTTPRFGMTVSELDAAYASSVASVPSLSLDMNFLPSEEVVVVATPTGSATSEKEVELQLRSLKIPLARITTEQALAASLQLCRVDHSLNVLRRELDEVSGAGWSQVAAKAAAPRKARPTERVGGSTAFTVLARRGKDRQGTAKRLGGEERTEPVVDDWEQAEEEAEQQEKAVVSVGDCDAD